MNKLPTVDDGTVRLKVDEREELAALRQWSTRVYGAIEHEPWAQGLIEIWRKAGG